MFVAVILTARPQVAVSTQALGNTIRVFKFSNQKLLRIPTMDLACTIIPQNQSVFCVGDILISPIRHSPTLLTKCYKRHTDPMLYVV